MQKECLDSANNLLSLVRLKTDAIGVAISFGKDSLTVLNLCCKIFSRVEGYYLFRVRGLSIVEGWADEVKKRYGVIVRMYPHFDLSRCYKNAVLQPHWATKAKTIKMPDIEKKFRVDANIDWIAYGWRRSDSRSRALIMKQCGGYDFKTRRVFPLRMWRRADVYEYLESQKIVIPDGLGRKEQGGLDFHPEALKRLRDDYPDDWKKWITDFPYSEIQVIDLPKSEHLKGDDNV
jgi:3'-phosphoadenosine 5'-phosphosulfate sulfotransferase (PAPS reductase)/FAD synthetase